jgi:long-chain alkane monooxygenase
MARRLLLNAFTEGTPSHNTHGSWRTPEAVAERSIYTMESWTELAQIAERGCFDTVMFADATMLADSINTTIRSGAFIQIDPKVVAPMMAAVTEHIGFVVTSSVMVPPFDFARWMATFDHLSNGRAAWNIVTSQPWVWQYYGHKTGPTGPERYAIAEEYMEVCYKLWEGTWDDQAVVHDPESGIWALPEHTRAVPHEGTYFFNPGRFPVEPSPQRTPVLYQAGSSPEGRAFSSKHAEASFINSASIAHGSSIIRDLGERAVAQGRHAEDLLVTQGFAFVVGSTDEEAKRRAEELDSYLSQEAASAKFLSHLGIDFEVDDLDAPLSRYSAGVTIRGLYDSVMAQFPAGYDPTPREIMAKRGKTAGTKVVGSPERIADFLREWFEAGLTSVNVLTDARNGNFETFVDHVVPELQRRGLTQREYTPGTLRHKLFGQGDRLPERHPAARYRHAPLLVS